MGLLEGAKETEKFESHSQKGLLTKVVETENWIDLKQWLLIAHWLTKIVCLCCLGTVILVFGLDFEQNKSS